VHRSPPGARQRDITASPGITERSAYGIVTDPAEAGSVAEQKDGAAETAAEGRPTSPTGQPFALAALRSRTKQPSRARRRGRTVPKPQARFPAVDTPAPGAWQSAGPTPAALMTSVPSRMSNGSDAELQPGHAAASLSSSGSSSRRIRPRPPAHRTATTAPFLQVEGHIEHRSQTRAAQWERRAEARQTTQLAGWTVRTFGGRPARRQQGGLQITVVLGAS
jgi:hypothetical protein